MFTPKLVEWYNKFKPAPPDFELVFVSSDRSEEAMQAYIKGDKMPWPAVAFARYSSDGIPYLVLIDEDARRSRPCRTTNGSRPRRCWPRSRKSSEDPDPAAGEGPATRGKHLCRAAAWIG
jgi:hypothetical protein